MKLHYLFRKKYMCAKRVGGEGLFSNSQFLLVFILFDIPSKDVLMGNKRVMTTFGLAKKMFKKYNTSQYNL